MGLPADPGKHAYAFLDGLWLKHSRGGEVRNVSVRVAIGVNADGYRKVLGIAEDTKEDKASRQGFSATSRTVASLA